MSFHLLMRRLRQEGILVILALLSMVSMNSVANDVVQISQAWVQSAPPVSRVQAGYFTVYNPTDQAITLLTPHSEQFEAVQIHETTMENEMMAMRHLTELNIPAQQSLTFKPGSLHLMLIGRKQSLNKGDEVIISFSFKQYADTQVVTFMVK